jgi:putative ABC transport system substrate-binding protein
MRRREFINLLRGAVLVLPLSARAQASTMPVIGFLNSASPGSAAPFVAAFRLGLEKAGLLEDRDFKIEYRWAEGEYDRLPALVADLIHRDVAVIAATGGLVAARAAEAATSTIPVLFIAGFDPVQEGLVSNLYQPTGNATGVSVYTAELGRKRLDLLRKLLPDLARVAMLVNPNSISTELERKDLEEASGIMGIQLSVVEANVAGDLDRAFGEVIKQNVGALLVSADPFFTSQRSQIVALASHYALPTSYPWSEYARDGGLMSYGTSLTWAYGQIGLYAGDVLKGAKPSELPIQLPMQFHMTINLKVAKSLGLRVPPELLALADETIE